MISSFRSASSLVAVVTLANLALLLAAEDATYDPVAEAARVVSKMNVKPGDSPQFGLSSFRNNVSVLKSLPTQWDGESGKNIKWTARLGSQTYSSPVVANGKLYIRDQGVLLCYDVKAK